MKQSINPVLIVVGVVLSGCASADGGDFVDEGVGQTQEASQCGSTQDFHNVESVGAGLNIPQAFVSAHQSPVGMQVNGTADACSGVMITTDLFLSPGHCQYVVGQVVRFDYQLDSGGVPRSTTPYVVTEILEQVWNADLDYAVVRISGQLGLSRGYAKIANDPPVTSNAGTRLTVIGHPELSGANYKKASSGSYSSTAASLGPNWFRFLADTTDQSSAGSPVFRRDGLLLGLHTDGGCTTSNTVGNQAMRMPSLLASSWAIRKAASMQGVQFARVDGASGADAIVVNAGATYVAASNGTAFSGAVNWTGGAFIPAGGAYFADVSGDGRADAIGIEPTGPGSVAHVRLSTGTSFSSTESSSFFREKHTAFGDVTGDGKADAIFVKPTGVVVQRSLGGEFDAPENWTTNPYFGTIGTYFADVTGDGKVDAIVINPSGITVRRSNASPRTKPGAERITALFDA